MQNRKLIKSCLWLLSILLVCAFAFAGCKSSPETTIVPPEETYAYSNPTKTWAEPDAGFVIDGVLDEPQYQNCNWLKLQNNQGGAGVDIAMTSYYGEKGMYIVYDVAENSMIYVNPDRPTYLNSCIEMYLASSNAVNMESNEVFEIDMLPTGDLSIRQRTGKNNWVNAATADNIMARLGATTKGGPVNTEECKGYNLELFIPWEYLDRVGLNASQMKQSFIYVNPIHITSYNYEGTESGTDRYWYAFATQLGSDGWNDIAQYFRFGKDGAIGTVAMALEQGEHYTVTGNDSIIPGMLTTVQITPDDGFALTSILVNGEEQIQKVAYNQDGSVTLSLRGEKDGLKISANAEAVADGKKTLSGTIRVNKLGGDTLEGVSLSYKGPGGEKPVTFDENGNFELTDLEPGYYVISAMKQGYRSINRGIYLDRDVETVVTLEYELFQAESGYNWILEEQNDGVLNRFGGSGKILSVDSYGKFAVEANFRYDTELAEMSDGDTFLQQRSGIQIRFSNGKFWRVDLMKENGVYKVQYAKHNESTLFSWKTVHTLTDEEIAKYQSEEGIKLSILRDGQVAWVCLDGKPVAIEVLDSEYSNLKARIGFEGWIANQEIESMEYDIREDFKQNLWSFYFTTNTQWDISRQLQGTVTLPKGGTAALPFYRQYRDVDVVLYNVKEHDRTGKKPGRTDLLMEFDTNGNGTIDKSVSFGIVCTNPATKTCWIQTLGNADNYIATTRVKGLYKLNAQQAEKYLNGGGVELEVIRKGTNVYVFLDGEEVAIWDLTQNNSGVKATTPAKLSIRHYDATGRDVKVKFKISGAVSEVEIDKIFKDNEKWDLSKQMEGVVTLPGGGTDTSLQLFKKYQNIDFTVLAKENDTTGKKFGRTDILFEFDLNNDGAMDKNVSFGVVQLSGGRCVIQTLGWPDKHIPATRINELYELDYAETLKYKTEGIHLRVVRYGTNAYVYLEDKQVAVFDLTQNNSGVTADSPATVSLRHYDAVADAVTIPFTVTDQVTEPTIVPLPTSVFKPNYKWDLSKQNEGIVTLPGGGTNAVVFYDSFTDIDLTITAKENKAATAPNGGRTDILFEFDLDNNGTMDKSVSFGIVKWSATSSCIVETLGNSNNHIPATRKNTLYTLNAAETEAYLADGVELRVVRMGTDVYVFVEGKAVAVFDLTQNNSGVTADMKATVSLRHYDAVADQVVIPFAVTAQLPNVTITDNSVNGTVTAGGSCQIGDTITLTGAAKDGYYLVGLKVDGTAVTLNADGTYSFTATRLSYTVEGIFREKLFVDNAAWDLSKQNLGTVTVDGIEKTQGVVSLPGGKTQTVVFCDPYTDIDITVIAKENDSTGSKPGRTDILFEFDLNSDGTMDKSVSFGVTKSHDEYLVQTLGNGNNYIPENRFTRLYALSEAEIERYLGNGVELRVIRKGTSVYVFLDGMAVAVFDLTQNNSGVTADMKTKVSLRHYDAVAAQVDIPFTITTQMPNVIITDSSVNGAIISEKASYAIGAEVVLSGEAKEGYFLAGLKVDGAEVTLNADGTYKFTAAKLTYTVEGIFREKLFVDNTAWDLSKQNLGAIVVDGIEKTQGIAILPGGKTQALAFRDLYTDVDLTITAKENKAATATNGGRTDILFEFDLNNDGTMDKSVSFGIVKWSATSSCIVETLGNSNNFIPASRKNTLYTLNAAETEAYLADGVELRVVRLGTDVHVFVEGKAVAVFDLTQNNSGVTADMKAKVSLRHYDAVADQVVIPFTIATEATKVTITDNSVNGMIVPGNANYTVGTEVVLSGEAKDGYYLAGLKVDGAAVTLTADGTYSFTATKAAYTVEGIFRAKLFVDNASWNLSKQNLGTVIVDSIERIQGVATLLGGGSKAVAFRNSYTDIDITVTAKEYDTTGKKPGRIDVLFEFENGKNVSFGVTCTVPDQKTCWVQTLGISTNYIPAKRINGLYNLSTAEAEKYLSGDGIALRVIRKGTNVIVLVEGNVVSIFDLTQNGSGVTADMKAKVSLRHYDAVADRVDIPFTVTDQAEEPVVRGAGYVPVMAQQVATSGSFSAFPRTIEITFNRNSLTSRAILFGNCDGKTLDYFNLERPANEDILYLNMCLNGVKYEHSFHLFHIPAGETLRVTVVFEDEAIKLYVNGSLTQTRTTSNGGNGSKTMGALWESAAKAKLPATWGIGDDLRKSFCFTGTIYDIAVWGDARTADEIADSSIAKLGTADYQDNLLVAYDFQATYKVTAVNPFHQDLSGNGNHLTGTLNVQTR